jgi:hypothetical protein
LVPSSALALLVTGVRADHHDATVTTNHLAVIAHRLDAWSYFHGFSLLVPVGDTASSEVVRGQFHLNLVARENADVVHTHLPGDVCEHLVSIVEFDLEHGIRQRLEDLALENDRIFLWLWQGTAPSPICASHHFVVRAPHLMRRGFRAASLVLSGIRLTACVFSICRQTG